MKLRAFIISILMLWFVACQPRKETTPPAADSTSTTVSKDTVAPGFLSEQQKAEGWVALFDGKTTTGWHFFKNKENNSWEISDGTLHCKPFIENGTNHRSDLTTDGQYENFELIFDWKISVQGNSGVMFRVSEEFDEPYASGPEYQIIDDEGYPGDLKDVQLTGANYDMHVASAKAAKPVGEWNESKLVVNGNHVEHWLNGIKVVEYELGSADWNKRRKVSKWKDFPGYGLTKKGSIDLQDHSHEVWFKNIAIKPL
ncbi:3-keto-disaccharide hydrolase [Ohtaekwangia sp.]|uniref:3-keto-disaccharide hydrolase n=1 Tax=Ohtaekwangia sp. TaxID=2066019 RepID=UPI002FDDBBA7